MNLPIPTDGGRTYRFQLRRGLQFSDGRPVRASDFRASMERLLRLNGVSVPPFYSGILGAERCSAQLGRCDLREGIEVDDAAGTVTIHLSAPDPDLLAKLALPFAFVLPADAPEPDQPVTDLGRFGDVGAYRIPGTGPYVAASFDPKHELRLTRNPRFKPFAPDAQPDGYPDQIVIRILGDGNISGAEKRSRRGGSREVRLDERTLIGGDRAARRSECRSTPYDAGGRCPASHAQHASAAVLRRPRSPRARVCNRPQSPCDACGRGARGKADLPGPAADRAGIPPLLPLHRHPGRRHLESPRPRARTSPGRAIAHPWRARGDRDSSGESG